MYMKPDVSSGIFFVFSPHFSHGLPPDLGEVQDAGIFVKHFKMNKAFSWNNLACTTQKKKTENFSYSL